MATLSITTSAQPPRPHTPRPPHPRSVVEQYFGKKFEAFKPMPDWEFKDYLGWGEQGDGKLFYGVYIQVGPAHVRMRVRVRACDCV